MNFISTSNCSLHQAMANQLLSNLRSHTRISKDFLVNILPSQKFVSVDEAEITHFFIGIVFLGQSQCASHNVFPPLRSGGGMICVSSARQGATAKLQELEWGHIQGGKMILGSQAGGRGGGGGLLYHDELLVFPQNVSP